MYNSHRGMVPAAANSRLTELLDNIRTEFDAQAQKTLEYERQLNGQLSEMELIRQQLGSLEQAHQAMKAKYEEEISRLTRELEARSSNPYQQQGAQNAGPSQPAPPVIGLGPNNLFGGIMSGQGSGAGLAPPSQQEPQPPVQPGHPQGPPTNLPPQGPPQHQQQPQQPQQQQQSQGYPGGFPNNGLSSIQGSRRPYANEPQGYPQQPPPPSQSPGPLRKTVVPTGNQTPVKTAAQQYPQDARGSPQVARPSPIPAVGNSLGDLDIDRLPANQKKEGADWFVVYNPALPRQLDVDLVHTLDHNSVVCCVRFSNDGKYVATGCNRTAQIFDVKTGQKVAYLQDETVDREGDLYIRSVCFSPDGRYLATGAEDKQIRVWDIQERRITHTFSGHDQDIYSLDFARDGRRIASGSGDRTVRVWDIESGSVLLTLSIEDGVTTVAMSPDGRYVAAGSLDKSVRVWDTNTGNLIERLEGNEGHRDSVYSVAFSPNGKDLVSGSLDRTIKMWELSAARGMMSGPGTGRGRCTRTFEGHKDFVLSVALTPDGQWVLSGSKDRAVQFWDPRTGNAQLMLQGHKNSVISVAPSPTGGLFATGSGDMRARIWSYEPYHAL
ncbi:WD40 repeat-like protein [Ascobolus immersus RN42]|uniref:WD40 repeat-like protein n=1 Tax=Ascobolus immersus RN42 TaxID=1160509 RepID=A0A3N4I1Z8_ASCIM|nr:WD40 repeat-like protein [Ascobolus immersus RN42]